MPLTTVVAIADAVLVTLAIAATCEEATATALAAIPAADVAIEFTIAILK